MKNIVVPGDVFWRLTVLRAFKDGRLKLHVRCVCGNEKTLFQSNVVSGKSRSCGCLALELLSAKARKTGRKGTPAYNSWRAMFDRCHNPSDTNYHRYGARGITVCDRWRSFDAFFVDMGERHKGQSIERIDNNQGYEPGNCRWATSKDQAANRRSTRYVNLNGAMVILEDAARTLGKPSSSLCKWAKRRGLPVQEAVNHYSRAA